MGHAPRARAAIVETMTRVAVLLLAGAFVLACGDDDGAAVDAGSDAGAEDAGGERDSGPTCPMSCAASEACCEVEGELRCIDVLADDENCGGCGIVCADGRGTECVRGSCVCGDFELGCGGDSESFCCPVNPPERNDRYCANLELDANDCGACGEACDPLQADRCDGGRCRCGDAREPCEGTASSTCCVGDFATECVDLTSDRAHCGECNRSCDFRESCVDGDCVPRFVEDAGAEDAGAEDAGPEDAGVEDAGTDAGVDAGGE